MKMTLEVLGAILMAMVPGFLVVCILTDRELRTAKSYLWYLPPVVLAAGSAVAMAVPGVPEVVCGVLCLGTVTAQVLCVLKDEEMSFHTARKTLFMVAACCAVFGTICWCVGY